jgi:tetratricopeptide (TPR) repeat protein
MGDPNKAIAMGRKSLEIDPDLHIAHLTLGGIYFENGQYEEAAEAYKKFLKVFPYFPETHNRLGIVYAAQKQFDKAIAEFEWEIRINPYHALAHLNLGKIYWYEFQNRQKAIYHLKTALMLDPLLPNRAEIRRLVRLLEGLS